MFNDFDTQIQSDELASLYYWDNSYEEEEVSSDDDADCFCD